MHNTITDKGIILDTDGKPMYELIEAKITGAVDRYNVDTFGGAVVKRIGFLSPVPPRHLDKDEYIHDSRPIAWPLVHPYWVVRMSADANMLMAYVEDEKDLLLYWPEATEITVFEENLSQYTFSPNFEMPTWIKEVWHHEFKVEPHRIGAYRIFNPENEDLNIIGFGEDVDYAIQVNNHKLEYGNHDDAEFQQQYDADDRGWRALEIQFYPCDDLEKAKKKAESLIKFHTSEGEIQANLHF